MSKRVREDVLDELFSGEKPSLAKELISTLQTCKVSPFCIGIVEWHQYLEEVKDSSCEFNFMVPNNPHIYTSVWKGDGRRYHTSRCKLRGDLPWSETRLYKSRYEAALREVFECLFIASWRCLRSKDLARIICRESFKERKTWFDKIL